MTRLQELTNRIAICKALTEYNKPAVVQVLTFISYQQIENRNYARCSRHLYYVADDNMSVVGDLSESSIR